MASPQVQLIYGISAGREAASARLRQALAPLSEDTRAVLSGLALGGCGILGSVCLAACLGAETDAVRVAYFVGFVILAWAAVLVGEAVFTRRGERLAIEREGLYVSQLGGWYFAPWRALGPFREAAGVVFVDDQRLQPHHWRRLVTPIVLDPAQYDLGNASQMCAELNAVREAALQEAP